MMRLRMFFLAFAFCFVFALPAEAGCFGPGEYEAEQGLRIHSELMVIGLTCQKMPGGAALYGKYQRFTQKNQYLISGYEDRLIGFYRNEGKSNPDGELHTLRTRLANEISRHAVRMSMVSFCQSFSSRIDKALGMDEKTLRKWAQQEWSSTRSSRPRCTRRVSY